MNETLDRGKNIDLLLFWPIVQVFEQDVEELVGFLVNGDTTLGWKIPQGIDNLVEDEDPFFYFLVGAKL